MFTLLLRFYRDRFLSRWTVLFFDVTATLIALIASIAFRFNFSVDQAQRVLNLPSFIGVLALYTFGYIAIGSHKGILRHTSLDDVKKVLKGTLWGFTLALVVTANLLLFWCWPIISYQHPLFSFHAHHTCIDWITPSSKKYLHRWNPSKN